MTDPRPEISAWAENIAAELVAARLALEPTSAIEYAATADEQLAYEVLITLARTVALVLRPAGHRPGPIGMHVTPTSRGIGYRIRAAQLVGFAAQGDVDMVDALARAALASPAGLEEARHTLWAILEVLASEPVQRHDPQEGPTP